MYYVLQSKNSKKIVLVTEDLQEIFTFFDKTMINGRFSLQYFIQSVQDDPNTWIVYKKMEVPVAVYTITSVPKVDWMAISPINAAHFVPED